MKKHFLLISLGILSALLLYSCATIIHGSDQEVNITSDPASAEIVITTAKGGVSVWEGTTPALIELPREDEYKVTVTLEGYEAGEVYINQKLSTVFWGNILCGGVIGIIVDLSNGAAYDLEPEQIHVSLVEVSSIDNMKEMYLVFNSLDENGKLQTNVLPLLRK